MRGWVCLLAVAIVMVLVAGLQAKETSNDWPQIRGLNRDGLSPETGLLQSWPEAGPREVWRRPLGAGFSGISVVGDRLYTMYAKGDGGEATEVAAAFDAANGKEIWSTAVAKRFEDSFGNGPRSTPAVDGKQLFVLGSYGHLVALSSKDGSELWRHDLREKFGSELPTFGFSTSPLVDGDRLLIEAGAPEGKAYVALAKKTGEVQWTAGETEDGPGYSSPIAVELNGRRGYVYVLGNKMAALDERGTEIWSHPWTYPGETHAMPIFVPPNRIYASGAEGVGASLVEIESDEETSKSEELWKTRFMRNHFNSSVIHDGYIYGFDNATLRCISAKDGETAWAKRGLGKGSLIFADGHILALSDRGVLVLIEANPEAYTEKGRVQALEGKCWTAPTLSNGRLFLRNHNEMVSYDLTGGEGA